MKYTIILEKGKSILEKGKSSYGAFVPDIPGCVAVGESRGEALKLIREAIEFHIDGLREERKMIPIPHCEITQVEVAIA